MSVNSIQICKFCKSQKPTVLNSDAKNIVLSETHYMNKKWASRTVTIKLPSTSQHQYCQTTHRNKNSNNVHYLQLKGVCARLRLLCKFQFLHPLWHIDPNRKWSSTFCLLQRPIANRAAKRETGWFLRNSLTRPLDHDSTSGKSAWFSSTVQQQIQSEEHLTQHLHRTLMHL